MKNVLIAYSLYIDPAVSSSVELERDELTARMGVIGRGAPQKLRYASTGASSIGDNSGVQFKKSCGNCGDKKHTSAKCPLETLDSKTKAVMIMQSIRMNTTNSNKLQRTNVRHEYFQQQYVSYHSENINFIFTTKTFSHILCRGWTPLRKKIID